MKKLFLLFLLVACQEEITPIVPHNSKHVITVSSNTDMTVKLFTNGFEVVLDFKANETQGIRVMVPIGEINYEARCENNEAVSGVTFNDLYIPCL